MKGFQRAWPWWRWALTGLSSLALALSAYLAWQYLFGGAAFGCGPGAPGCAQVLTSRWSTIGGVLPVSGLAVGVYLAMVIATLSVGPATAASVRRLAWGAMLVLAGAAAGSALWFTIVQKWSIGAFCPYCMATHITGLLLAALVVWRAPRQFEDDSTDGISTNPASGPTDDGVRRTEDGSQTTVLSSVLRRLSSAPIGSPLVGLALAGILAACQLGFAPPAVYRGGESARNLPTLDPRAVPLVGSPEAPYVVKLLFDYKCPHCQQMHFLLNEAIRRYGGKLAFVLCPTPLNPECNPYISREADEFNGSCELAKVGLAVWVANRKEFPAFDHWMFSFESGDRWHARSLDAAKAKAIELVGQAKFDAARADSWIDRYMQTSIGIYAATLQSGNGAIPKLVFGSRWVIPEPHDADGLVSILQDSLAVPRP